MMHAAEGDAKGWRNTFTSLFPNLLMVEILDSDPCDATTDGSRRVQGSMRYPLTTPVRWLLVTYFCIIKGRFALTIKGAYYGILDPLHIPDCA